MTDRTDPCRLNENHICEGCPPEWCARAGVEPQGDPDYIDPAVLKARAAARDIQVGQQPVVRRDHS
jgi:hypothetical protein